MRVLGVKRFAERMHFPFHSFLNGTSLVLFVSALFFCPVKAKYKMNQETKTVISEEATTVRG